MSPWPVVPPMTFDKLVAVFPLVRQQGPLLDSFRAQIARRAQAGTDGWRSPIHHTRFEPSLFLEFSWQPMTWRAPCISQFLRC